eukprot:scaffold524101_cov18-Prasinocladus_malaysianus.AAC.2
MRPRRWSATQAICGPIRTTSKETTSHTIRERLIDLIMQAAATQCGNDEAPVAVNREVGHILSRAKAQRLTIPDVSWSEYTTYGGFWGCPDKLPIVQNGWDTAMNLVS